MSKLYLMCGIPGSGKSTFIMNHIEEDSQVWISRDAIRYELVKPDEPYFSKETLVFNTFVDMICKALDDDYEVFADATHLNPASRRKLLNRIPKHLYDELAIIWVKVDPSVAVAQNEKRKGTRAYVPPKEIKKMHYSFSVPTFDEGFDEIIIVEQNEPIKICKKGKDYA